MKKGLICAVLLLCFCAALTAQTPIYNPSNTPTTGGANSWPFNLYTGWRMQIIIDKNVLGNTPFLIQEVAFAPTSTRTFSVPDFQMRMGHTTYKDFGTAGTTLFATIIGPNPVEVYQRGKISWACTSGTWCDIGLTGPFAYNGNDNICMEIRYNTTASGGTTIHTDASIARAYTHSRYSNDPFNDPNWYTPIPGEFMGPKHRLSVLQGFMLDADATVSVGKTANILLKSGVGGEFYQVAASLSTLPINLGKCTIHLTPDNLFWGSMQIGPPIFTRYSGILSASGSGAAQLAVPNVPALVGVVVYHAAVSFSSTVFPTACTNTDSTQIVK